MDFIKADKISYSYPVPEGTDVFGENSQKENVQKNHSQKNHSQENHSQKKNSQEDRLLKERFEKEKSQKEQKNERKEPVLREVSLSVHRGQFLCILGRNGSGKSTFARHLNALLVPDEGTIWIDGMDTRDEQHLWDIRKTVGMVFQNPDNQIIGSVVDEDVAFGLENIGIPSEEIRNGVQRVLDQVGMGEYVKASPNKLSGGQKQRVAVAGVLAMCPKCIVLDESTSMLDPHGRGEVMDTVRKLNQEQNITVISITHYMEEALEADYIFVMDQGQLVLQGTPREIFSQEEELEALGLKLPQLCQLAKALRKEGMQIPRGICSAEELKAAVTSELAGQKQAETEALS